jgi:hypothetical protein
MDNEEQEYEQEDVQDLAARTTRLSDDERATLLAELDRQDPDF